MHFTLTGKSSGKTYTLLINQIDEQKSMLEFLRQNGFPIASSCRGEQVCRLCTINETILSCSISVEDFYNKVGQ
jgi:hypothetical protein